MIDGLGKTYVNAIHRAVGTCLRDAFRKGRITRDVATMIRAPSPKKSSPYILSVREWNSVIEASKLEIDGLLVALILHTGLRVDVEALSLAWPQIDFEEGTVTVGRSKTEAEQGRVVSLDADLLSRLHGRRSQHSETGTESAGLWNPHEYVFCNGAGKRHSVGNLRRRMFMRVKETAGVPYRLTFRDLRHNYGSYLISKGVSIPTVSKRLGHANAAITMSVYAHELPDDDVKVRQAMSEIKA
jgi:integrase